MVNFPFKKKGKLRRITLGICAMDKKAKSKPMREILQRLPDELFEIVYFGDDMILNKPIETWPVVEVSYLIKHIAARLPLYYNPSLVILGVDRVLFHSLPDRKSLAICQATQTIPDKRP